MRKGKKKIYNLKSAYDHKEMAVSLNNGSNISHESELGLVTTHISCNIFLSTFSPTFVFHRNYLSYVYGFVSCMYVWAAFVSLVPTEARKGHPLDLEL